ncbi:MAG: TonB-dependent receptor [Spirosomaceae bacterium]|nr:TonB-dependent receptor [Spirosomataceae bacterium]
MYKGVFKCLCVCLLLWGHAWAQDRTISGTVKSKEDGSALPGVSVLIKGTSRGVNSNSDGTYQISVPSGNVQLVFSFVGFEKQEVSVGNRSTINLEMNPDASQLNEIVVTGYGGALNKREITGSISKVKGQQIENMPVQSFDRAIQGRAAGVQVQAANGIPGGAVQVRIRGIGSISGGNDPLYVVDGVQINSRGTSTITSSNPLNFLNPNDIESIEILKDAAAASIYGSQAANGVVIVTTKKGKAGKTQFDLNYFTGVVEPLQKLNVLNTQQWIQMRSEAFFNQGVVSNPAYTRQQALTAALTGVRLAGDLSESQIAALPTYDWQNEAFKNGIIQNAELSASGGTDKTTFYWSGGYLQQSANVINIDFLRGTTSLGVTHKLSNKVTFDSKISLSTQKGRGQFGGPLGGSFLGAAAFSTPLIIPSVPIRKDDGSYFGTAAEGGIPGVLNQNVIMVSELNKIQGIQNQAVGTMSLNWKIAEGLTFRPSASIDYRTIKGDNYTDPRTPDAFNVAGRLGFQYNQNVNFLTNAVLNYNKTFQEKHGVSALAGYEYRSDVNEGYFGTVEGFPSPDFKYASSGTNYITTGGGWNGFRRESVFGQLKYDFKNKYFFSATARYDGSSRFGANNRFGLFPAVSGGWLITEDFLKNSKVVNQLKLRASYGVTGNDQIGFFPALGLAGGGFNYNNVSGVAPTQMSNPNLKWERNITGEIGLEYSLFNNRVTGQVNYFDRQSRDLLLNRPLPITSGFSSIVDNVGQLQNRGYEFEITTINVKKGKFKWETNFNFTYINNRVTKLVDGILPQQNRDSLILLSAPVFTGLGNNTGDITLGRNFIVGKPVYALYTVRYAGVNPATGRPMFYDENDNLVYNFRSPGDLKYVGSEFAPIYGGFTNTFSYGGLEVSAFFQYEIGRMAFNNQGSFLSENGNRLFNTLTDVYERRWQNPGDITDVPRPYNGGAELRGAGNMSGTRTLENASYLRLKQVNVSYDLPQSILRPVKFIRRAQIYMQALNLLTWTAWTGYDPEFVGLGSGNNGVIPQSRNYTFGVRVGF